MEKGLKNVIEAGDAEIIRMAMKDRGVLQVDLADRLGMKQSSVSGNINRRKMGLDVFRTMLDAMDYDVAVIDRATGEVRWILEK